MAHTLTAHTGFGDFHAATVADNTFISDLFVLSAMALPVLARTEDTLTVQTIFLRFERTIVDRLRLGYFSMRPFKNSLRGCQANFNRIKAHWLIIIIIRYFRHERHLLYSSYPISSSASTDSSSS